MGVTSPGRRGVECGRPRPPESQHIRRETDTEIGAPVAYGDRRTCCGGVPRGGAGRRREAFGHKSILLKFWEIGRFSLRQMSCFRGVNASPDGEIPPKVRQMARDQAFEIPRRLSVRRSGRRSGERRAWGSLFVCLHPFRDAPYLHTLCGALLIFSPRLCRKKECRIPSFPNKFPPSWT